MSPPRSRVVLVGAGHAHLPLLRRGRAFTERGHELVLVSPDDFWYSGLATGVVAGQYAPETDRIEVGPLVERAGGRWLRDRVVEVEAGRRILRLASGASLSWDVASLNVGSRLPPERPPGAAEHALPVKPVRDLVRLPERLAREGGGHVVVVGGGASACEVALALEARFRGGEVPLEITLVSDAPVLHEVGGGAGEAAGRTLVERGVRVLEGVPVERVEPWGVRLADGRRFEADVVVNATGVVPPPLARESGLEVDDDGALRVDRFLRSVGEPALFGGGDCVRFEPRPLPRVGVYAVRQAPVLLHNLLATLDGTPLRPFRPQDRYLLVLNLGDGTGLAVRGGLRWRGRSAFLLKDRLDRSFLQG